MEAHRCGPTRKHYQALGWNVDFPLLWKPYECRPYSQVVSDDWGIEPPRMYKYGYSHANCGGCCFRQGQGDWLRTMRHFPTRYAAAERWEEKMRAGQERKYAILRRQVGGDIFPLSLQEFRLQQEVQLELQPSLFELDQEATCVRCGIGIS